MPESPEICYEYRNAIIAYHFQLGMQQQEICDRLKVDETAVSKFIAAIKELVPNYQSENITAILAAHAAAEPTDLAIPIRRESDVEQDESLGLEEEDRACSSGERHASGRTFFQACALMASNQSRACMPLQSIGRKGISIRIRYPALTRLTSLLTMECQC
jgi:hypothetical protein